MKIRAIIAAGGKSSRFNGIYKELLLANNNDTFLDLNIKKCLDLGCNEIIIVTNEEKITLHAKSIVRNKLNDKIKLVIQSNQDNDLLGAIKLGQSLECNNLLLMADTYFVSDFSFANKPFTFGIFQTYFPQYFTTISKSNRLYSKGFASDESAPFNAWGCVYWNIDVANYISTKINIDHDIVFQECIDRYGIDFFPITDYYDIGDLNRYSKYLRDKNG